MEGEGIEAGLYAFIIKYKIYRLYTPSRLPGRRDVELHHPGSFGFGVQWLLLYSIFIGIGCMVPGLPLSKYGSFYVQTDRYVHAT